MTRDDVLRLLLVAVDDAARVFDYADLADWPAGTLEALERLGLLRPCSGGLTATCPNCPDRHIEPVEFRDGLDGRHRLFIRCSEDLRVEVTPEMCRGWEVDPEGLARAVVGALALTGAPKPIVLDRLWRLGRIPWEGKTREVVFARRLGDDDAGAIAAHIGVGGRAIVLVPHLVPDERVWAGRTPAVVALSGVATLEGEHIVIDGVALTEIVVEADHVAEQRSVLPIDPEIKRQIVRRQAEVVLDTRLERDVLVAAYKEHGTIRKAAEVLTETLGRTITKDRVHRAVMAAGGAKAVMAGSDSASVARTVASQSRDRSKKFLERR